MRKKPYSWVSKTPFPFTGWREIVETSEQVIGRFASRYQNGSPAVIRSDRATYLAMVPSGALLQNILREVLDWAGLEVTETHQDLRLTRRGDLRFAFNFGDQDQPLPVNSKRKLLVGEDPVAAHSLAIWTE